jgi:hypothetical protein
VPPVIFEFSRYGSTIVIVCVEVVVSNVRCQDGYSGFLLLQVEGVCWNIPLNIIGFVFDRALSLLGSFTLLYYFGRSWVETMSSQ